MNISDHFAKICKDVRRLHNISKQSSKMLRSYKIKFKSLKQFIGPNLVAHITSLLPSPVNTTYFQSTEREILVIRWSSYNKFLSAHHSGETDK